MSVTVTLSSRSRYKDTNVYLGGRTGDDPQPVFALFVAPPEFTSERAGYRFHKVKATEVGFLDLIAVRYYGQGHEELWWVIALANAMIDPEKEMEPGQQIIVPPRDALTDFLSRTGRNIEVQ